MPTFIERAVLPVSDRAEFRYTFAHSSAPHAGAAPLLICLHPGWNGEAPPAYYGSEFLTSVFLPAFGRTGAILACPDCPSGAWNNETSRGAVHGLIDHFVTTSEADPERVSLAGYSAGGWGVWYLLRHAPRRFASAVVIAAPPVIDPVDAFADNFSKTRQALAGRLEEWVNGIPDIPITIIHSQDDEILRWEESQAASRALLQAGRRVDLHLIQGVGHFEGQGYVPALSASSDWLVQTWRPSNREVR
jgi:pimeloyl-ACP methyl ester carboxylesterase